MHRNTRRGVTLLEVIIGNVIFLALLGVALASMMSVSEGGATVQQIALLEQETNRAIERMAEELREAQPQGLPWSGDNAIVYLVPVDPDGDGDFLDGNLDIEWGSRRPEYTPSDFTDLAPARYRFVATGSFSEPARTLDLNGDGDRMDVFDLGHLEKVFPSGTSASRGITVPAMTVAITPDVILQEPGQTVADIDDDGTDDPLFFPDGSFLRINVFVTDPDARYPPFRRLTTAVSLRN